jgi:hypothetical protein
LDGIRIFLETTNLKKLMWIWSGASVAHKAPVQDYLGSILTQTQMAFQTTDLKKIPLVCDIAISS